MVLVKYNAKNVYYCGTLRLIPGVNEVADLSLKSVQSHSLFKHRVDSGIIEMLRAGVSPEAVRDQAGHSSLEMTNKYVMIVRTAADEQILSKINY